MKPAAARAAVILAVVSGALGLIGVVVVLAHAGHNADVFVRDHPNRSRALGLAGSYILAGLVLVLSSLEFLGAWLLRKGRRSGWLLLLILAGFEALSVFTTRSVPAILSLVPDLMLLVCLLLPSTRTAFQKTPRAAL